MESGGNFEFDEMGGLQKLQVQSASLVAIGTNPLDSDFSLARLPVLTTHTVLPGPVNLCRRGRSPGLSRSLMPRVQLGPEVFPSPDIAPPLRACYKVV